MAHRDEVYVRVEFVGGPKDGDTMPWRRRFVEQLPVIRIPVRRPVNLATGERLPVDAAPDARELHYTIILESKRHAGCVVISPFLLAEAVNAEREIDYLTRRLRPVLYRHVP